MYMLEIYRYLMAAGCRVYHLKATVEPVSTEDDGGNSDERKWQL